MKVVPYSDLHSLSEDERIDVIGHAVVDNNLKVGFLVDSDKKKIARYKEKLLRRFPLVMITHEGPHSIKGVYFIVAERRVASGQA